MDLFKRNKRTKRLYQFTHTRYDAHDSVILHEVGEVEGYTEKQIKHCLVKRCGFASVGKLDVFGRWNVSVHPHSHQR